MPSAAVGQAGRPEPELAGKTARPTSPACGTGWRAWAPGSSAVSPAPGAAAGPPPTAASSTSWRLRTSPSSGRSGLTRAWSRQAPGLARAAPCSLCKASCAAWLAGVPPWLIRCQPAQVFALLLGTEQLLTSFDAINLLNPAVDKAPPSGWLHVDQSPRTPHLACLQGLVNLAPVSPDTSGEPGSGAARPGLAVPGQPCRARRTLHSVQPALDCGARAGLP